MLRFYDVQSVTQVLSQVNQCQHFCLSQLYFYFVSCVQINAIVILDCCATRIYFVGQHLNSLFYLVEDCPLGEVTGILLANTNLTCANIENYNCEADPTIRRKCCITCPTLQTPWLGPQCPYGDKNPRCSNLTQDLCSTFGDTCCQRCCLVNGPDPGYSCDPLISNKTTPAASTSSTATKLPFTKDLQGVKLFFICFDEGCRIQYAKCVSV